MKADFGFRRVPWPISNIAALAVLFAWPAAQAVAAPAPPGPEPTPAYIFLEVPATAGQPAAEYGVLSVTFDADVGVPLRRHGDATSEDADVKATLILAKPNAPIGLAVKVRYAALEILETDANRKTLRRISFRNAIVTSIGPDGDDPAERVTFAARSVNVH
jgi:hypothetical protein